MDMRHAPLYVCSTRRQGVGRSRAEFAVRADVVLLSHNIRGRRPACRHGVAIHLRTGSGNRPATCALPPSPAVSTHGGYGWMGHHSTGARHNWAVARTVPKTYRAA